jgi:hypothetical protein
LLDGGLTVLSGWDGLSSVGNACDCTPPDTDVAVGPAHVVETVNTALAVYNKATGTRVLRQEMTALFAPLGGVLRLSDPVVSYDELSHRFVIGVLDFQEHSQSRFDFAVSNDADPTHGFTLRRYDTNDGVGGFDFADYPRLGWNADAYVISFNMFVNDVRYDHVDTLSIDKASLTGFRQMVPGGLANHTLAPATMHSAAPGDPLWLVEGAGGNSNGDAIGGDVVKVVEMTNVLSDNPTYTTTPLPVTPYAIPPRASQPEGLFEIVTNDARVLNAAWDHGRLVASQTVGTGGLAHARFYEFDTGGAVPALIQFGDIAPGPGVHTYFPAIEIAASGRLAMTFLESSATEFMSMYVTGQTETESPGTMKAPVLVRAGTANYGRLRTGDFAGIGVDPAQPNRFWVANQYAAPPQDDFNWNTWVASFALPVAGPIVLDVTPSGNTFAPVDTLRVTFDVAMDVSTATPDQFALHDSQGNLIAVDVAVVPDSGDRQFDVTFAAQTRAGSYTLAIGPFIADKAGRFMDQNQNGIPGEDPDDQFTGGFVIQAPQVVRSVVPGGPFVPFASVRVTFNEPIDAATFTPDQVTQFTDPDGNAIPVTDVRPVEDSGGRQFDILFPSQAALGTYALVLGPDIRDPFGNPMEQPYTTALNVFNPCLGPDGSGYTACAHPFQDLELLGQAGTFTILEFADDDFRQVDLHGSTFTFYGNTYTSLFVNSNGLITFGSGTTSYLNSDLSSRPAQPAIAPLWSDWIKLSGTPMLLGKFDGDHLILEWNDVHHFISAGAISPLGVTFQVVLTLNTGSDPGDILFNYPDLDTGDRHAKGATATIGIKAAGVQGDNRLLVSFNGLSPFVQSGQALLFSTAAAGPRSGGAKAVIGAGLARPVTIGADQDTLPGHGDGTFGPARFFEAGRFRQAIAVADFDGDAQRVDGRLAVSGRGWWKPASSWRIPDGPATQPGAWVNDIDTARALVDQVFLEEVFNRD